MFYSNEGFLNLSFNPIKLIFKKGMDMNIEFVLINENDNSELLPQN